ncbi:MAG: Ig-like domain-containing protein, partial [Cyclobacteriaceae bacterium]
MKTRLIPVLTLCLIWSQSLFAQELFYGNGYDVATPRGSLALAYKTSFDVSGEEITPGALIFKPDGTKMYVIGTSGKKVNQYSLSIPFDLASTITLDHQYNTGRSVSGLRFSGDGMKLTILSGRTFYQYILSAAYDLSQTVTYDGSEQIFPSGESSLLGFEFNSDGTRVYAVGVDLHEYSLSTAYDFTSTVTFLNTYDITDGSGYSSEIAFNNDGTLMFLGSQHSSGELNKIYRYSLSSAYNITGTVTLEETFDTEPYVVGLTAFAFSASGNDIFAVGTGTDEVAQFGLETPFEFDTEPTTELEGSYIASVQVGSAQDITFSDDGYLMHIIGAAKTSIYQYTLSIPFDITSTVTFDDYYDVGSRETAPTDMTFSDDGMTLFVVGTSNNSVIQYGLSSAYDVGSTVIYEGSRDVSAQQSGVEGITFSSDGMHFFIAGHVDGNGASSEVHQYAITTAFDVTSSTTFEETYAYWNRELSDLTFSDDGQTMLILDNDRIRLDQIDLDTPFELDYGMSYPEYVGGWNVPSEGIPNGIAFSACGTRMYIVGSENNTVYQYRLSSTGVFLETSSNDGSVSGSAKIQLTGDTFTNSGGTLSAKNEYAISNLPSGLSPNLEVSDDGTYVTLTLDGEANNGEDVDDLDDLIFTFEDAAFGKLPASSIANSISARSGFSINFKDNNEPTVENPIADVSRIGGFITAGIDLSSTFEDVDDQSLTYSAISLNTSVATVSVSGDILTFNEQGAGTTTITVTANDGEGGTVAESFDLTITAKPKALAYGLGYDLVTASNVTFEHVTTGNIASGTPAGITFGNDGSKLFFAYSGSVWQYSLEAPYDMTSNASYDGFYNFSSQESSAADVHFSYDGMKMYVAGSAGNPDYIEQYLLTVPFDITLGVTYDGPANVGNSNPTAVAFNNTGNKMYVGNAYGGASIEQFSVTTPFDALSGLTSDGSVSLSELTNIGAWSFNHDGSKLFVLDATAHDIEEYALSANYDITSGLTHLGIFSLVGFDNAPRGIAFNKNGSKVYSVGYGIDDVNQFAVGTTGGFIETSANDGSVEGSLLISLSFDSFTNTNSTLEHEVDYTIDNLPAGLIPDLTVSENGDYAVLTLGGAATSAKEDADDIASLIFTFENSAFEDGDAASVTAAVSASSGFGIDFSDNNVPTLENTISDNSETLGFGYKIYDLTGMFADGDDQTLDISASSDDHNVVTVSLDGNNLTVTQAGVGTATITVTANDGNDGEIQDSFHFEVIADAPALTFGQGYDVSSATFSGATSGLLSEFSFPYSYGVSFNPDGTRMFILFESHIAQFKVSTPFDANTATTLDIDLGFTEETDMTDLAFSADGLKLFLTGTNGAPDYIEQYTLGAPFDLTSGVTHDGSHPIGLSQPHTITFNNDGTKLFVFNYEPSIYEYTLSTPYDILSGTSLVGSEDLSSEMSVPGTMVFSNDGLIMTILDRINGNVIVYELASPYNVLGTRTDLGSLDVSSINSPTGIHFNIDGSQMFIIGGNYDEVATYDAVKTGGFEESIANDGEVDGSLGINLTFDSFMQVGSTLTHGVDFTVDNLPNGLVPVLNIMDAHHAVLTFEGQAVNHEIANDVADIQLTFANSAFAGGDAAAISNTSSASSGFGIEFLPDTTPPTITLFSPNNGAAGVLNDTPIVLTFSEPVQLTGVGTINIKRVSNNASLHSIDPAGAEVVIDENVVTITPDGGILSTEEEVQVYVNWSTTPFEDLAGNDFNDLFGDSDYRFTVDNDIDEVPPSPVTFSPADEAINVSPSADLVITFDEEVESTGQVRYARVKRKSNDEILMSMAMHDPAVTDVSG